MLKVVTSNTQVELTKPYECFDKNSGFDNERKLELPVLKPDCLSVDLIFFLH